MAFPTGWPPTPPSGTRSIRAYVTGNTTADFDDNAYLFADLTGANTFTPTPYVRPGSTAPVDFSKTPLGTGQAPQDVNSSTTDPAKQPVPHKMIWSYGLRICNDGANPIEISFDGTHVHGKLLTGEKFDYQVRHEAGIALRFPAGGGASSFRVEAW